MNSKRTNFSDEKDLAMVGYTIIGIIVFTLLYLSAINNELAKKRYSERSTQNENNLTIREQEEIEQKKGELLNLIIRLGTASINPPYLSIFQV